MFTDRIQVGESFYALGEISGRPGSYYVPSGTHGTHMAQLICKVCPVVKLYMAQLKVLPGKYGRRSFHSRVRCRGEYIYENNLSPVLSPNPERKLTRAQAIIWATKQGVDIISMSWSINANDKMTMLDAALRSAANGNIIMFCASIDEGVTAVDRTYPGIVHECIKMGAYTGSGSYPGCLRRKSQYLLPGDALQSVSERDSTSSSSPVSTALAAGLAGVLLYCSRLVKSDGKSTLPQDESLRTNGI